MNNYERTNNNLQSTTQKTNDRAMLTPLLTESELYVLWKGKKLSCSTSGTHRSTLVTNPLISHE